MLKELKRRVSAANRDLVRTGLVTLTWGNVTYQFESPLKYSIRGQKIELRTYQDLSWVAHYAGQPIELRVVEKPERFKIAA